jgi:hypothetical protein
LSRRRSSSAPQSSEEPLHEPAPRFRAQSLDGSRTKERTRRLSSGRARKAPYNSAGEQPSWGFCAPPAFTSAGSDTRQGYLPRLCSVFRFSQPHDASFRPRSSGLVSCRIRPWGLLSFQRVPPPGSRHDLRRTLPLLLTGHPCENPGHAGIEASGRSVHHQAVLPNLAGRSSPSLEPLRGLVSPLEPWLRAFAKPPLLGLATTLNGPMLWLLFRVSKNSRIGLSLARTAFLPGVFIPKYLKVS